MFFSFCVNINLYQKLLNNLQAAFAERLLDEVLLQLKLYDCLYSKKGISRGGGLPFWNVVRIDL